MKFQMSLYLIIPQSLEFRFSFKNCLFCGYYGKYGLAIKNTTEKLLKFYLNENKT